MSAQLHVAYDNQSPIDLNSTSEHLALLFSQECGFRPLPWMQRNMTDYLRRGFDPALIEEAIRRTSQAPRPSWAYLAAIMNNAAAAQTYDLQEFLSASMARIPARQGPRQSYTYLDQAITLDF